MVDEKGPLAPRIDVPLFLFLLVGRRGDEEMGYGGEEELVAVEVEKGELLLVEGGEGGVDGSFEVVVVVDEGANVGKDVVDCVAERA
jgi:hypothetical protein